MDNWELVYEGWDPAQEPIREALCTLGNGFFATRGATEESRAGSSHYPGTYLAGGYNRLRSEVKGREIENEDLVNWPNWLCLGFRFPGGSWFELREEGLLEYRQALDLAGGILSRRILFDDEKGRRTLIESRRFVSMADPHTAAVEWTVTPVNWSGAVEIRSELDGNVINRGVPRYSDLAQHHLEYVDSGRSRERTVYLSPRTTQSHIVTAMAART
ncbi:MAG: glycoside hydrolase family 65 protein, partial [Acidobacteriota bacterium]